MWKLSAIPRIEVTGQELLAAAQAETAQDVRQSNGQRRPRQAHCRTGRRTASARRRRAGEHGVELFLNSRVFAH